MNFYYEYETSINPRTPRVVGTNPLSFFPCNFFDDSNGESSSSSLFNDESAPYGLFIVR